MKVAIHQPEYWPCLPLLAKIRQADLLVILDDVQFKRDSLQQRCKVAGPGGVQWLSIPYVHAHPQLIRDVRPVDGDWRRRHAETIRQLYRKAPGFKQPWPAVEEFYASEYGTVCEAAAASMAVLLHVFGGPPMIRSSDLGTKGHKGDLVLDLCKRVGATQYLTGKGGAAYLDTGAFAAAGVEIVLSAYQVQKYRDGQPEDAGLSALDAWFWLGDKAKELLGG